MNIGDIVKVMAGGGGLAGILAIGGLTFVSPYGPFQPKPEICTAQQTCVIVAGLYRDVNWGPGVGGQAFGFDLHDEMRSQLVDYLMDTHPNVQVRRLPEEIAIPVSGVQGEVQADARTVAHAREIGQHYHASLVVIGQVEGARVRLMFVDPMDATQTLHLKPYSIPDNSESASQLGSMFEFALARATHQAIPAAVAAAQSPADNATLNTNTEAGPPAVSSPAAFTGPFIPPSAQQAETPKGQAQLSDEDRRNLTNLISGLLDGAQQQGMSPARNFRDEITGLQPGHDDRWQVRLTAGTPYRIIGACDNECSNLDIELLDPRGSVVAYDRNGDDFPVVNFTPAISATYTVRTMLQACSVAPCYVGARILTSNNDASQALSGGPKP